MRAELIKLGLEALKTEGAERISLRSLAERAGVSKTAPYRHFNDRESFLGAVADEGFRLLCEELERAEAKAAGGSAIAGEGPGGIVAVMGNAYMDFAVGHPALYRLMNSPLICGLPEGSLVWARRSLLLLGKALASDSAASGAQAGFQGAALDIDAIASSWGYIHGIVLLRIDGLFPKDLPQPDWKRLATTVPKPP